MLTFFTWVTGLMLVPYVVVGGVLAVLSYRKVRIGKKAGLRSDGFFANYTEAIVSSVLVILFGVLFGTLHVGNDETLLWFGLLLFTTIVNGCFIYFSLYLLMEKWEHFQNKIAEKIDIHRFSTYFGKMDLGNRNRFKRIFNIYPFEHPQKYTEYELDKNRDEQALIQIAKAYNQLIEWETVHAALPDVRLMKAEDKAFVESLKQQIDELTKALQASGEFIRSLIVKNEDIHFSEKQLEAMEKLRSMSVQPTPEKTFIHPTLEALIQVQTMPGVSADRVQEAKRLEVEVKQLLKERKTPWKPNELADTNLNAVKLHHGIQ